MWSAWRIRAAGSSHNPGRPPQGLCLLLRVRGRSSKMKLGKRSWGYGFQAATKKNFLSRREDQVGGGGFATNREAKGDESI